MRIAIGCLHVTAPIDVLSLSRSVEVMPAYINPVPVQELAAEVRELLDGTSLYLVGMMGRYSCFTLVILLV